MSIAPPRRSLDERARLGAEAFARHVEPHLRPEHRGLFVAVDIDTGEYEIDKSDLAAVIRLGARIPGVESFLMMAGYPTAYRSLGMREVQ